MKIRKINKKGQEEMVGFALIMIIVAVIFIIFLSISLRRKPVTEVKKSYEIESFLQASQQYTTECALDYEPNYRNIRDLIRDCSEGNICVNGKTSCSVLEQSYSDVITHSFSVSKESTVKSYYLAITVAGNLIMNKTHGNRTGATSFKSSTQTLPGDIEINLKVYS